MRILIVDDEPLNLDVLEQELQSLDCQIVSAADGLSALKSIDYEFPEIVVTDYKMPEMTGLELLTQIKQIDPDLPVVLISAHGDISIAVEAMHGGAYDFIERPYEADRLRESVTRALDARRLVLENRALKAELKLILKSRLEERILGNDPLIVELQKTIADVADTDATVLIVGETGTGKELVARSLHDLSQRAKKHFVPINCGAMNENLIESELFGHEAGSFTGANKRRTGKFEYAHQGTLFLDEIDSMPLDLQKRLLRVLENHEFERLGSNETVPVDFRLISATQKNLLDSAEKEKFRKDLYYRLNVIQIHVPSLQDRLDDIPLLYDTFLNRFAAQHQKPVPVVTPDNLQMLMSHSWPGNVRELRNFAERHVLVGLNKGGFQISVEGMLSTDKTRRSLPEKVAAYEKCLIAQALAENNGNIKQTAETLIIPTRTLYDLMKKHNLNRDDYQ